ncbi:Putative uncharacterized protein [Taphrina deformans PYCC 5710]|uniref:Structural maintenance of chromosomes protein n=1 Tax=Taphrina deformans (strain PYCC 5710 / ATCC 11124 / CBS 356.35 / IMI 108563 / JCM 9778 / NBRC 8474) TaxID=1097556 RepID=R4XG69_TAPDE|nr:Putative uncharacterized protein [Taphrina deformans PYCC 5710]|eukprot:CCG83489.1 Putative uncharacterized protein [Taphrina deformans PYCC 5710]
MRIESLVIDGFKSYAVRTEVFFDATFTAITGLNGSGKSNILDSICFVLGITNMTTLRAQNLQDLIYKRGQAGVTKASVTIVFANDNKDTAPVGFSTQDFPTISVTRQIVMGGTSKYLINGHRAQQQTVQNLFQSVQLNINNPNFLIMQGKITKVLNMKPLEILSMIEEAAGTRMFEERKDKAIKNIAKKEAKVQEINLLLAEEVEPKLEKLRTEKRAWLEFQQLQSELERATKLVVAHDYNRLNEKISRAASDLKSKKDTVARLEHSQETSKQQITKLADDIKQINARREKEMRKGGNFAKLEANAKKLSHDLVRMTTNLELKQTSMAEDLKRQHIFENSLQVLRKQVKDKQSAHDVAEKSYSSMKASFDVLNKDFVQKEELLQTLSTGFSSKAGQDSGYLDLLAEAQARATQSHTTQEQAKLKISHYEQRLKEEEPRAKRAQEQNQALMRDLDSLRSVIQRHEAKLEALGHDERTHKSSLAEQSRLKSLITQHTEKVEILRRKVANIDFTYSDPVPNFDRKQVKGLVAQLFSLDEKNFSSATALEICAGGRLYNVVVENEKVGSMLLSHGKLRKRVTIIPLNKISATRAAAERIGAAQSLAPGKVNLALSLLGYDEEVTAAMEYVFGNTLICADSETAKRVTFDNSVRMHSVTMDGDVYDPSGTLSGGSKPNSSGVLVILQQLNKAQQALDACRAQSNDLESRLQRDSKKNQEAQKLQQDLDLKHHEISVTEQQISTNSDSRTLQEIEEMRSEILALKEAAKVAKLEQEKAKCDVKTIEKDIKEFKSNKDGKLATLQKDVDKLRNVVADQVKTVKAAHKDLQLLGLELEQLITEVTTSEEQLKELIETSEAQALEISGLAKDQDTTKDEYEQIEAQLVDQRAQLTTFDDELKELEAASREKSNQVAQFSLESQQLIHEIERFAKETQASEQNLQSMLKEHDWIADAVSDFGKANSIYDYSRHNMSDIKASLKSLSEKYASMKKRVNPKVMNMIDGVEKKELALKTMVRTIHKDKTKIEETIVTLEEYKIEALDKTWKKVTVDFGNIFGELLPGNTAKLVPLEGKEVTQGLEVKVCLGKVWKQSLTELSGGQRSLIALSLIMSLLQYKPAPMYILDEVDAALDPSHTQNIGRLIKTRFKGSQFVVVSLKDGMFTNANRIFRTKFMDNTSVVFTS